MKSPDEAFDNLMRLSPEREWSMTWVESNWNSCYEIGYDDGKKTNHTHLKIFIDEGSLKCAIYGWFWYPYILGYRDGSGDKIWGD